VDTIARYQSRLLDLVHQAVSVYSKALKSDDLHVAAAAATKLLEGLHALHKGGIESTIQAANRHTPQWNQRQQRLLLMGQMAELAIEQSRKYSMPLPADLASIRNELERADESV
jgi:hypothetical protein